MRKYLLLLLGLCNLYGGLRLDGFVVAYNVKCKTKGTTQQRVARVCAILLVVSGRQYSDRDLPSGIYKVSPGSNGDELIVELKNGNKKQWKLGADLIIQDDGLDVY